MVTYDQDRLDEAIMNSVGLDWWSFNGPGQPGFARILAIREAAHVRWFRQAPEDEDALVLRAAWHDLTTHGHFNFVEDEDEEDDE